MDPTGKVALVTGGAHRVGKAITLMLARAGAHVVVNYHSAADAASQTVAEVKAEGVDALAVQCDVADWPQVQAMAATIEERFGGVDIIINSASLFETMPFPTTDLETWHRVTAISIDGPFYVCNALAPTMQARGGGVIVNIVDLSAWEPCPKFMAHSVGKAALLALTRQLALELAPAIRANAVAPGPVLPPPDYDERRAQAAAARTLLGRWGSPDDVARAVRYLIEADYVTGDVVTVDGGERYGHRKPQAAR
ncbi:MAG TPA: SDR family oxidoreductase [Caldilineaceae bacterium]|nr:SDR family oxidoreductase [Caldilineaceae bacterium]